MILGTRFLLCSVVSICLLLVAACGTTTTTVPTSTTNEQQPPVETNDLEQPPLNPPPAVANADEVRRYQGTTITYYGDSVGLGAQLDTLLAEQFTHDTGIQVNVLPRPEDSTECYERYQQLFQEQSTTVDVITLDVIWPGAFAPHLVDLGPSFQDVASEHFASIIENNTVDGKLVAIPWFADFGMLYYRTDLLKKYGFDGPPETWDDMETMAQTIQQGERAAGNDSFVGWVFQGTAYEGLTCNALEWVASHGGGTLIEGEDVTINNPAAIHALDRASGWIGTIAPESVISYKEEESRQVFQQGNAAFMRNWPYAYAAITEDNAPVAGHFDVAPIPHEVGQKSTSVVGGWQLGVSAYSQHQEAATAFVRYLASPEVQKWRAITGSYLPTIRAVAEDPQVLEALPFLKKFASIERITRPSRKAGVYYPDVSNAFFYGVYEILIERDAPQVVPRMEQNMEKVMQEMTSK